MQVGVVGTGTMGAGMAGSLLRAGHEVRVWNRDVTRTEPLRAAGATVAADLASLAAGADVVFTMLYDEAATRERARDFLPALRPDAVWIQSATVGPAGARRLGDLAAEYGASMVDGPVLGTKAPAEDGTLTALVSGDAELLTRVRPALDAISAKIVEAGPIVGDASALKLACNAMVSTLTAATAQSIAMMASFGLDPALFLEALDGGPIGAPYTQLKGRAMIAQDWTPSFGVDGVVKDVDLMIDATGERTARVLTAVRAAYAAASEAGHGSDDLAAVLRAFEGPA